MSQEKIKIVILTNQNDDLAAKIIPILKEMDGFSFEDIISFMEIPKEHSFIIDRIKKVMGMICRFYENIFLYPEVEKDLFTVSSGFGILVHKCNNIYSLESTDLIRSLSPNLLIACGINSLKKPITDIPSLGSIKVHHEKTQGFWVLWNNEKKIGAPIYYINNTEEICEIISEQTVPIFEYDTLSSVKAKSMELLLDVLPEVIRQIASPQKQKRLQLLNTGSQHPPPTVYQRIYLFYLIKKRQFSLLLFIKTIIKKIFFSFRLMYILLRDIYLLRRGENILSALSYHRINNIFKDGMTVDINSFEKQIRFLKKHYYFLSAEDLNDLLDGDIRFKHKKCVLITFDDGYEDNYRNALPILEKYGCPAIFFISTGLIGNDKQFEHDHKYHPQLIFKKMTWEQLQNAMLRGIDVGIHSDTHANLGKISVNDAIREIETSIAKYRANLKKNPKLMAYPFGSKEDISEEVVSYIRNNKYISILLSLYGNKKNIGQKDRYNIRRINIGTMDKGLIFWFKVEGAAITKSYEGYI